MAYSGWQKTRDGDYYNFSGYSIVDDVVEHFNTVSFSEALAAYGVTTVGSFVVGLLESGSWAIAAGALSGMGILIGAEQLMEASYIDMLKADTREAIRGLEDNGGAGYIVVEADFFRFVGGSGNNWSGERELPVRVFYSRYRK
ncbi:MAG: hypothetical protein ACOYVK_00070 [Bacillota bacterium]